MVNGREEKQGLARSYVYTGELVIPKRSWDPSVMDKEIVIVQNLHHTHFVDPYEMKRVHPEVAMLEGKIHNIETIHRKMEQNVFGVKQRLSTGAFTEVDGNIVIKFAIPIIIHATVLRSQPDSNHVEIGIPKTGKVYINFLKDDVGRNLRGRYSSDCLFTEGTFVAAGMMDDNTHRRIVQEYPVLNDSLRKMAILTTYVPMLIGILVFMKIIFTMSGFSPVEHEQSHPKEKND